ncbi:MAG: thiamine diphosphokinase [Syntrophothermaceae bacterium]|jgi:thiamine pyrophosphokinase
MKWIILTGGDYGEAAFSSEYLKEIVPGDRIIAVDSGANFAWQVGLQPEFLVGDMDSINPAVYNKMKEQGVKVHTYPRAKDYTDTQLALKLAEESGASRIAIMGFTGSRLDHVLATLYSGIRLVRKGIKVTYLAPEFRVYLLNGNLQLTGESGDLVSLVALTENVTGVSLTGFAYPLHQATLQLDKPYAVSNQMLSDSAQIEVGQGIVAVFHYE